MTPAVGDGTGLRAPSIVGRFSPLPWLGYAADSVVPEDCHLALVAARAPLGAIREGAQSDNRRATTRDGPAGVETAVRWPRYGGPELPPHVGRSNSRAQYKRCSIVQRSLIAATRP